MKGKFMDDYTIEAILCTAIRGLGLLTEALEIALNTYQVNIAESKEVFITKENNQIIGKDELHE